jgi:hypothetical protein
MAADEVLGAEGMDSVAEAMLSRDRTRSSGYVVHTDVTPANAPARSRVGVSSGRVPWNVKSW